MIELTAVKIILLIVSTGAFVGLLVNFDGANLGISEQKCEALVAPMVVLFVGLATAALVFF